METKQRKKPSVFIVFDDLLELKFRTFVDRHAPSSSMTSKRIISGSRVSVSSKTTSPVSLKTGTAIKRTVCPAGPSMTVVANLGWLPTKKTWGHSSITNGSSS